MPRNNMILAKDRLPRDGKGVDNLLAQLGQYLRSPENRFVQKIVVDVTRAYIYFEKLMDKDAAEDADTGISYHDAVRRVQMEEVAFDKDINPPPLAYLFQMFTTIHNHGYEACHLLVGPSSGLYKWLGLPRTKERVFGVPIIKVPELPNDVMLLTGSRARDSDPEDIEYSVKGNIT